MDRELDLRESPKGAGVWAFRTVAPAEFVEASANISVAAPYTGLLVNCLVFNASAGTSDTATHTITLPTNFKPDTKAWPGKLNFSVWAASVSQNLVAANDDLDLEVRFIIKPGPTATDRTEIALAYRDCNLGNTVIADPPKAFGGKHTIDIMDLLTEAQKALLVPETQIVAQLRPHETVGTNVALVVSGAQWSWLSHFNVKSSDLADNTTAN